MWLTDYITKNTLKKAEPNIGKITNSCAENVVVDAELEHRNVPIVAPYGIAYNPKKNEKSLIIPIENTCACIGVVSKNQELDEGELMLYSSGGASIVLKNNGDVVINGKVFE